LVLALCLAAFWKRNGHVYPQSAAETRGGLGLEARGSAFLGSLPETVHTRDYSQAISTKKAHHPPVEGHTGLNCLGLCAFPTTCCVSERLLLFLTFSEEL